MIAPFAALLAQTTTTAIPEYRPFLTPMPVWNAWPWLILPLCLGVSIVYKAIKCNSMSEVPKQALLITLWILGGMAAAGLVLAVLVKIL